MALAWNIVLIVIAINFSIYAVQEISDIHVIKYQEDLVTLSFFEGKVPSNPEELGYVDYGKYIFGNFIGGFLAIIKIIFLGPLAVRNLLDAFGLLSNPFSTGLQIFLWIAYISFYAEWIGSRSLQAIK